jgi:hypothetical protein
MTTTIPTDAFDLATDKLDKAGAILSALSAAYDDKHGFIASDEVVWLTLLSARDLVEAAQAALEPKD